MDADTQKSNIGEPTQSLSVESWDPNRSEVTINIDELGSKCAQNSYENDTRLELHKVGQDMIVLQACAEKKVSVDKCCPKKEVPVCGLGAPGISYVPGNNEFVLKVFLAVLVMLCVILLLVMIMLLTTPLYNLLPNVVTTFILFLIGGCCAKDLICAVLFWTRIRRVPHIYICLALSVIFYTLLIIGFGAYFNALIVLGSVLTLIVVAGAALLMASMKMDFTKLFIVFVIAFLALLLMLLIVGLTTEFITLSINTFIPPLIIVLQAAFFILEMQIILEGRTIDVNEKEHLLGAYLVCNSFLEIKYNLLFRLLNRQLRC